MCSILWRDLRHLVMVGQISPDRTRFTSKWTYLTRVVPEDQISDLFALLEAIIRQTFLPSLTGQSLLSDYEHETMALPVQLGGLGIINPTKLSSLQSLNITLPLCDMILKEPITYLLPCTLAEQVVKKTSSAAHRQAENDSQTHLLSKFPPRRQRIIPFL